MVYPLKVAKYIIKKCHLNLLLTVKNGQNMTIQQLKISVVLLVHRYVEGSANTSFVFPACMGSPIKNYSGNIVNDPARLTMVRYQNAN